MDLVRRLALLSCVGLLVAGCGSRLSAEEIRAGGEVSQVSLPQDFLESLRAPAAQAAAAGAAEVTAAAPVPPPAFPRERPRRRARRLRPRRRPRQRPRSP